MKKDAQNLFQITEAARACGLSRSTLMRMEDRGLLAPAHVSPTSGQRYYDNFNIARILQVEKFKAMGLDTEEIADYFARGGEASELLAALESRLRELERSVEEMRLRAADGPATSVQVMRLPAVTCCMRWYTGVAYENHYAAMYDFYSECIRKGHVLSGDSLFILSERKDYLEGFISDEPYRYAVCVPVRPEIAPKDAVTLPECRVLSVLYCGDYSGMDEMWLTLGREVKARGLTPVDAPRILGIVAPYTGREIEAKRYCSRLVLPVKE